MIMKTTMTTIFSSSLPALDLNLRILAYSELLLQYFVRNEKIVRRIDINIERSNIKYLAQKVHQLIDTLLNDPNIHKLCFSCKVLPIFWTSIVSNTCRRFRFRLRTCRFSMISPLHFGRCFNLASFTWTV